MERVFLEDVARRGLGRFEAVERDGRLTALCHVGANVVPSGVGCSVFARAAARGRPRMVIGEERAVGELWDVARHRMARPRADRPGQPVYVIEEPPETGDTGLRPATLARPRTARARVRTHAPGGDRGQPAQARSRGLPLADAGAGRGGPLVAVGGGRHDPLQGGGLRVDAERDPDPAGLGRPGGARARQRPARDARPRAAAAPARAACACSSAPRTRPRSGSTRRSGCSRPAPTGGCCSEEGGGSLRNSSLPSWTVVFLVRHGESEVSVRAAVSSDPAVALPADGTRRGAGARARARARRRVRSTSAS